ncbi:MAG: hypothetical protein OEN56_01125 [Gemmatimonadota bacterium]|nr:hypothetical protein [Gemmatimonadota bacterium]
MRRWVFVALVLGTAGCDTEQVESAVRAIGAELASLTVSELGDLASRVAEDPGVADSILAANGVDIGQLDSILGALGSQAEVVGAALAGMTVRDVGELASRITEDRSVADSLLAANGVEIGQLDEVLDRIGPDAEALAAYLASLAQEHTR